MTLRADFGLRHRRLFCALLPRSKLDSFRLGGLLGETQMDDLVIPHVLNSVSWFVVDVFGDGLNEPGDIFGIDAARDFAEGEITDPSRRRECLTRVLRLLMDVETSWVWMNTNHGVDVAWVKKLKQSKMPNAFA